MTGVGIYQGPMFVKHTYFDRFTTLYWNDAWTEKLGKRPVSNAGAISWKKDSTYPIYTSQYTTNLTFGYCDNVSTRSEYRQQRLDEKFPFVGPTPCNTRTHISPIYFPVRFSVFNSVLRQKYLTTCSLVKPLIFPFNAQTDHSQDRQHCLFPCNVTSFHATLVVNRHYLFSGNVLIFSFNAQTGSCHYLFPGNVLIFPFMLRQLSLFVPW